MTLPLFGAAVVPTLLILWFFLARDHHSEPRAVLLRTFALGVLITLPAGLLELGLQAAIEPLGLSPSAKSLTFAFLGPALCEEALKLWVVYGYCRSHSAFDEPIDGIIYGVTASLGFATLENVLYVASNGMGVAVARALMAVPGHASWGALMGYYVAQAHFNPDRRLRHLALALGLPILLHGLYDFPILLLGEPGSGAELALPWLWLPLVVLLGGWRLALGQLRALRRIQLEALPRPESATSQPFPEEPQELEPGMWSVDGAASRQSTSERPAWQHSAGPDYATGSVKAGAGAVKLLSAPASRVGALFQLGLGGLLSWWGGLVTLAAAAGALEEATVGDELVHLLLGTVLIGVIPLVLGLWLFRRGLAAAAPAR